MRSDAETCSEDPEERISMRRIMKSRSSYSRRVLAILMAVLAPSACGAPSNGAVPGQQASIGVGPADPVVDSVTTGPPLRNPARARIRVHFAPPVDADSIEVVTPRSDGMVVWASSVPTQLRGAWEGVWAQDRPPTEGCVAFARAWLGSQASNAVPVDWCLLVAAGSGGTSSPPASSPAANPVANSAANPAASPAANSSPGPPSSQLPACWFRVTWSGGNVSGTEVWDGPDYPWLLGGALFGTGDFLQGEQTLVNILLDQLWPRPGPGYAHLLVPGATFTPETMSLGVTTPNYQMGVKWVLGSRFNPGPAEVRITDVRNGVVEGTATAAMRSEVYASIPFDPNDPGPNAVNVTVDFRFPLGSDGTADCPTPDDWGPP